MRKPNGYGSVKKMSGRRRRPFVYVVSQDGRQKSIAYFATQLEAEIFAADYVKEHKGTFLVDHKMTLAELYQRWLPRHITDTAPSKSAICGYANAYRHLESLHLRSYTDLKYTDYQRIIDKMRKAGLSYSSAKKVRSLISLLESFADKLELGGRRYAQLLSLGRNIPVQPHRPFTRQKINRLWNIVDVPGVDTILILLYTGMRVGELLQLQKSDISLRQQTIKITRSKTAAGIRTIPIHHRIRPLIEARMMMPGKTLIADKNGCGYSYSRYCTLWTRIMHSIRGDGHTTHDCRHTVATLLDNEGANETAKRRLLGHSGGDVTERVYTHKGLRQLRRCIELLK